MAQTLDTTVEVWPEGAEEFGVERSLTMAERDKIDDSDFAWPDAPDHPKYPINTQAHLDAAAKLIGRAPADKQAAIKARAKRIAKRKGLKLPDSWLDDGDSDDSKDRAMGGSAITTIVGNDGKHHDPHVGTHSHRHDHTIDGYSHEHPHDHTDDNMHDHGHAQSHRRSVDGTHVDEGHTHTPEERAKYADTEMPLESQPEQERATVTPIQASDRQHVMSLPLVRIDTAKREVWGQATAEVPDSYGTIFGFYPEAWTKWRGNIREQHDPKKAVGKAIDITPDPEERAIYVGSRVSRGAQDTWLKVEDNVLSGYSASIIPDPEFGNNPAKWPKKMYNGKEYPYLPRYTVAELSLVDNPACPGCNIQIVRADGFATDVLDVTEEEPVVEQKQETQDRAGARVGSATKGKMHESIGHTLQAAKSQMQNCGCQTCLDAIKVLDPDDDDDIDLGGYDDPDGDWQSLYKGKEKDMERVVTELIERSLQPVYTRLQGICGTLARSNATATPMNIDQLITSTITRAFETFESRIAEIPTKSSFDEVRAELSAVKGQVDKIAEQPMPGGPILNASVMPRPPIEKSLATDPMPQPDNERSYGAVYAALQEMSRRGALDTPEKQIDAMAAGLAAQRRR